MKTYYVNLEDSGKITMFKTTYSEGLTKVVTDVVIDFSTGITEYFLVNGTVVERTIEEVVNSLEKKKSKQIKLGKVSKAKVTTSTNKTFDGDETSQDRMLRAIQIADITGQTTTQWKLADNSIAEVTLEELKEALALAGQEMSRIWLEQ